MPATAPHRARPGLPTMIRRAIRRRCPWCAQRRAWFTGWFAKQERCPGCGLRWARNPGFITGSMTINIIVTFGVMTVVLAGVAIATLPDLPVTPVMALLAAIGVVLPVVLYPVTCTVWAAVELAMQPPEAKELSAARQHLADVTGRADPAG